MTDQAYALRELVERRQSLAAAALDERGCATRARTIAVTSGKGGVGKSNITLNLGIGLATLGARVCLLDANMGLGNLDLLCGLNGYWNLSHVVTGARNLSDIILEGPCGVDVIPGASGLVESADCPPAAQREILNQLDELEQTHDFLLIDTGAGIHRLVRQFVTAAETVLVVTTPEPTAIADAYATVKSLSADATRELSVLVNQCDSESQAEAILARFEQTARLFLHRSIGAAGWIPHDAIVPQAVQRRTPFVLEHPESPASAAVLRLARRLRNQTVPHTTTTAFFPRVWSPMTKAA